MIAITKMGGIAGPLFSALGPEAVKDRALDCSCKYFITSPYLYKRIESIMDDLVDVEKFIIVGDDAGLGDNTVRFDEVMASGDPDFQAVDMAPTDPYIIHYTSGSTGKPKGVLLGHKSMIQQWFTSRNCSRPQRGGHLLVHGRPGLGHRHILWHLRPVVPGNDHRLL